MAGQACEAIRDQLYAFLDDALDIQMTLKIQAHLEACPTCLQRYQFVLNMRRLLREEAAAFMVPPQLEARLRKLGRAGRGWPKRLRPMLQPAVLVVAAVLLVLVPAGLFLRFSPPADLVPRLVAHHRAILHEQIPLSLRSSNPQQVITWLREQVPFFVDIPQASLAGFLPVGATTFALPEGTGVYVLYKRQGESLAYMVSIGKETTLPAGKTVAIGSHTLSLHREGGYTIGLWRVDGRTYALISQAGEQEFLEYAAICIRLSL